MMTAGNIKYTVDDENKIITATVDGCTHDAIDMMLKAFRRQNILLRDMYISKIESTYDPEKDTGEDDPNDPCLTIETTESSATTCKKFLLKDTSEGTAIYHPDDNNPYSVERGKEIARRRLYDAYNKDYKKALDNLMDAIYEAVNGDMEESSMITSERITNFKYYEYYDIFKYNLEESNKL